MRVKKIGVLAVGAVAAGGLALGGAAMAVAAPATPVPDSSAGPGRDGGPGRHGGKHTEVTGDEAAKVTAAVTAKDATVTVSRVWKGDDGSYRVVGARGGERVHFEVSADLKTVTEGKAPRGRGPGGFGGGAEVTGDEAAKVTAAVTAKDATVTVSRVGKGPDGVYHVFGTRNGERVHFEVSADLKTVTEGTAGKGGPGPRPGRGHGWDGRGPDRDGGRPGPSPSRTS